MARPSKSLIKHWYKLLKDSGFVDVEGRTKWTGSTMGPKVILKGAFGL
jgi:hypothetical protein